MYVLKPKKPKQNKTNTKNESDYFKTSLYHLVHLPPKQCHV